MIPGSGLNVCWRMMAGCPGYLVWGRCLTISAVTWSGWRWMVARSCMFASRCFCG
nr:MAG TPA: hypothetical protein [Caudoviricetes sp.]